MRRTLIVRELVRADQKRHAKEQLGQILLSAGLDVPRLWRSGMLGFPLIPSPAGLGSRLASGPYGPASFGPERIGLP
jgi:hypothetical protein